MATMHRFGRCEVHVAERRLRIAGKPVPVGARAYDLLLTLIDNANRVVTKDELLEAVWPGLVVEEGNIAVQIAALRKLLGPEAIATIPGRGYQFAVALDDAPVGPEQAGADIPHASSNSPAMPGFGGMDEPPPLYGRDTEIAYACALLQDHKLVTIVGAPGIGKTTLAQAIGHRLRDRFVDGVWMVELASLSEGALVPATMARALGMSMTSERPAPSSVAVALSGRAALVIIDNCEHLLVCCPADT